MNQEQTPPVLAPITVRDFATTLRVLRTLEDFQRVQYVNIPNIMGHVPAFKSQITPAISAVAHFAEWLPQLTPRIPPRNQQQRRNKR